MKGNEDILHEKRNNENQIGGVREYTRFNRAMLIDTKAAVFATSWGMFQILGENLTSYLESRINRDPANYSDDLYNIYINEGGNDLDDFINKQEASEYYHLLDFLAYIKARQIQGKRLIDYISGSDDNLIDWEKFLYGYNGPDYKKNKYDIRLAKAYRKFAGRKASETTETVETQKSAETSEAAKAAETTETEEAGPGQTITTRIPIIDGGFGGIFKGKDDTQGNFYRFTGPDQNNIEVNEGVINQKIAQRLIQKLSEESIPFYDLDTNNPNDMANPVHASSVAIAAPAGTNAAAVEDGGDECRFLTERGYDRSGRRVLVEWTVCFDDAGTAYVPDEGRRILARF